MPLSRIVRPCMDDPRSFSGVVRSHRVTPWSDRSRGLPDGSRARACFGFTASVSQMTKICLAAAVAATIALTGSSAAGADLAIKAPTSPLTWTGGYLGLNAGGAWGDAHSYLALIQNNGSNPLSNAVLTSAGNAGFSPSSLSGGGQLGFNYQFAQRFVGGAEVDWAHFDLNASRQTLPIARAPDPAADFSDNLRIRSLATFRARLGFLATPQLLLFLTGGIAVADIDYRQRIHFVQVPDNSFNQGSVSGWRTGRAVGAGAEYAFLPHWTAKAEYLYTTFKSAGFVSANTFDPAYALRHGIDANVSIGRVGINYRF
jgi:outer membrane immunogenic protein